MPNEYWCAYKRLTEYNVAGRLLRSSRRLLVYGSCVREEHPEIFELFEEGRIALSACPEAEHINVIALKLASIFARTKLEEVIILTVDGSPHCLQLHHAAEEAAKIAGSELNVSHYVIEEGRAVEVSREAIKTARYLSKVDKLLARHNK